MKVTIAPAALEIGEGPLVEIQTEDGPAHVFYYFLNVEHGGDTYEHPHAFRWESEVEDFRATVARRGVIDLSRWNKIERGPSLEERLGPGGIEWEREQDDRFAWGA